jgi:tetratricopeptide (TPR) repeat protein
LTPRFDDPIDDYSVGYLKGRALAGLGRWPEAIAAYDTAIDNRLQKHGADWVDYRYFVARAVARLAHQQPDKALADLDKALKNNPKSAMANYHRGCALLLLNRRTEAITAFRDARFFVRGEPFERDYYYEQPDAAYPEDIEAALTEGK